MSAVESTSISEQQKNVLDRMWDSARARAAAEDSLYGKFECYVSEFRGVIQFIAGFATVGEQAGPNDIADENLERRLHENWEHAPLNNKRDFLAWVLKTIESVAVPSCNNLEQWTAAVFQRLYALPDEERSVLIECFLSGVPFGEFVHDKEVTEPRARALFDHGMKHLFSGDLRFDQGAGSHANGLANGENGTSKQFRSYVLDALRQSPAFAELPTIKALRGFVPGPGVKTELVSDELIGVSPSEIILDSECGSNGSALATEGRNGSSRDCGTLHEQDMGELGPRDVTTGNGAAEATNGYAEVPQHLFDIDAHSVDANGSLGAPTATELAEPRLVQKLSERIKRRPRPFAWLAEKFAAMVWNLLD